VSGPVENPYRFRKAKFPHQILRERRPDVIANSAGRTGPIRYDDLTPGRQDLFEKQLNAYRLGRALVRAADEAALTGQPVHGGLVTAWVTARNAWRWMSNT
jgi:hypothetical protein